MAMLVHVSVCWPLELQRSWSRRIRKFDRLQSILARRTGTVFLPQVCCVMLLDNSVIVYSGQLGDRTPILRTTEESDCDSSPVAGKRAKQVCFVRAEVFQFHS
jgi:hypothetical protein